MTLKMDGNQILMLRHGEYPSRLTFEQGETFPGNYQTPYGALDIETDTKELTYTKGANGSLSVDYSVGMGGTGMLRNTLKITWKERTSV